MICDGVSSDLMFSTSHVIFYLSCCFCFSVSFEGSHGIGYLRGSCYSCLDDLHEGNKVNKYAMIVVRLKHLKSPRPEREISNIYIYLVIYIYGLVLYLLLDHSTDFNLVHILLVLMQLQKDRESCVLNPKLLGSLE